MTTKTLIFLFGVMVGIVIMKFHADFQTSTTTVAVQAARDAAPIEPSRPEHPLNTKAFEESEIKNIPTIQAEQEQREDTDSTSFASLSVSETAIGNLESKRDELKSLIYSETTNEGWRIHVLHEDNLLTTAGIRDGDLITYESLDQERLNPGRAQLASRLMSVLNYIKR